MTKVFEHFLEEILYMDFFIRSGSQPGELEDASNG